MENDRTPTAFLVLYAVHGTSATTEVRRVTLLHCVIQFESQFVQSYMQWCSRLFVSYGEVIHGHIRPVDFHSEFLEQIKIIHSILLDDTNAAPGDNTALSLISTYTQADSDTDIIQVWQTVFILPPLVTISL